MAIILHIPEHRIARNLGWFLQEQLNANINTYMVEQLQFENDNQHVQDLLCAAWGREEKIARIGRWVL